jgi:small subunit ribosomal protein S10
MSTETIRIKLKAYDHMLLDDACKRIINTANKSGAKVVGPIPLPTDKEVITVIRSPFKHKDSREQFESRTHKRMIEIISPNAKAVDALMKIELPAGVDIKIKI